jgi:hypothetical protein
MTASPLTKSALSQRLFKKYLILPQLYKNNMRTVYILFLLLSDFICTAQKPQFKVQFSKPYAVYTFVERLSSQYPANGFKDAYEKSVFKNAELDAIIEAFDTLDISQSYHHEGFPYGQKMPFMSVTMIRHNLVESSSPADFRNRMLGIIPNTQLNTIVRTLEKFTPVYDQLIYQPNRAAFEAQLSRLANYIATKDIAAYFDTGLHFYNSQWDAATPFIINIFPTVGSNGFRATAIINNAISEVPVTFNDYDVLFSVMMHEIFHILYDEQSLQVKINIEKWFNESKSAGAQYAYLLLNEALATALGNGYVYEQLTGAIDKDDWYYTPYINQIAKKIYPVVKQYAIVRKPIDKNFVDAYIAAYDTFPGWTSEVNHIFTYRAIVTDDEKDLEYFAQHFRHASIQDYEIPLTSIALSKLKDKPVTRFIIISGDNEKKLKIVTDAFPELKKYKLKASDEFVQQHRMPNKTWLIVVNRKTSSLEKLMGGFLKDGGLP